MVQLKLLYKMSTPFLLIHSGTASTLFPAIDLLAVPVEICPVIYFACIKEVDVNNPANNLLVSGNLYCTNISSPFVRLLPTFVL